jgi:hypothetical protein
VYAFLTWTLDCGIFQPNAPAALALEIGARYLLVGNLGAKKSFWLLRTRKKSETLTCIARRQPAYPANGLGAVQTELSYLNPHTKLS